MPQDDRTSKFFGTLSILFWLGAQFPQVIVNIRTQSVEGLALPFLANWLFGDISNLLGCILTHQLPFQTYLAAYFCLVDFSLLAQYLYYYKPPPSLPPSPSEETSPISASTPLLEDGLLHSVTERYGSISSRPYSAVSASYPPAGLLIGSDDVPTHGHFKGRSRSRARTLSLSKRKTLRDLQTTAANIAQTADSLLHQRHGHQRPRSASYVGDSRPTPLSGTADTTAGAGGPRFVEPNNDAEEDETNPLVESFYSEAGGSHPRRRSITWTTTGLSLPQPIERREIANAEHESTPHGETESTRLRQRSRSRGRPTTRHPFEITPLEAVPGSYIESPTETSEQPVEGALINLRLPRMSASGSRASGKRSAGIVFLSVGVGALFAFGTHMDSKGIGDRRTSAAEKGKGRVLGVGLADKETGTKSNDYAESRTPVAHIFYADINDEPTPSSHHRDERMEWNTEEKRRIFGRIAAWTCTTLYLTSRLPQIWKNFTRKSVQGLSLALFVFAFLGNLCYVLSILFSPVLYSAPAVETPSPSTLPTATLLPPSALAADVPPKTGWTSPAGRAFLRESLPYLLGSGGTLAFDIIIVGQGLYYKRRERQLEEMSEDEEQEEVREAEREPLLKGAEAHH